jgi:uncharacterized protein YbaP (TraB family)
MLKALAAALVLAVASLASGAALAAPALWVVRAPGAEIYLFGTVHALSPRAAGWRTPAYDQAYERARTVWFEADLEGADPATVSRLMSRYGFDPDRTLSQKLAPRSLSELKPLLAQGRTPLDRVEHLRPWAAALMLTMQPIFAAGGQMEQGADFTMTRQAKAETKQVRAFETLEDQVRIFAGLSEQAELGYLSDVIAERHGHGHRLARKAPDLETAWLAGDMTRLSAVAAADMARQNPEFYDALVRRRNQSWADILTRELDRGAGAELVNVGALHMAGPDGLPTLLKARGFEVERVQ